MPLLRRQEVAVLEPPEDLDDEELVFHIPFTGEIFREYEDYLERIKLYEEPQWQCGVTGKLHLTYEEALESERAGTAKLTTFPDSHVEATVRAIHHATDKLEQLVDRLYQRFRDEYVVGEVLKHKGDEVVVVGVHDAASNGHDEPDATMDSDDEPLVKQSSVTAKVYSVRASSAADASGGDVVTVPSQDLTRKRHPLPKALLKAFIRDVTYPRDPYPKAPWIVKDNFREEYGLPEELPADLAAAKQSYEQTEERKRKAAAALEENVKRQKAEKEAAEKKKEEPQYPIEDTLLPADPALAPRPLPSTDFLVAQELVGQLLLTWQFLNTFSQAIRLSAFSLDDYEKALVYDGSQGAAERSTDYGDMCPLLSAAVVALLRVVINEYNTEAMAAVEDSDSDNEAPRRRKASPAEGLLEQPAEDNWDAVLQSYIERQREKQRGVLVPERIANEEYLRGGMDAACKLVLLQYLCDEVAQTSVFREHVDAMLEDLKNLHGTRRVERAEFKQQKRAQEQALARSNAGSRTSNGSDGSSESESDDEEDEPAKGGAAEPDAAKMDLTSRSAMLEYKKMQRAAEEARKQQELEAQRKQQAARNAEQRAEYAARKKIQQLKMDEEKKEAKYQLQKLRLTGYRYTALGEDRDNASYWYLLDSARILRQTATGTWGYYSTPAELEQLVNSLNGKGIRECQLLNNLRTHYATINTALRRRQEELKRDEDGRRSARLQDRHRNLAFLYYVNHLARPSRSAA